MSRIALWLTLSCAFLLAGCGGGDQAAPSAPAIPGAVAEDLAAQADAVADTLEAGDQCGAAHQADELVASVEAAVEGGQVPAQLQDSLTETAVKLQDTINCPPRDEKDEEKKGKGKGKGNGNGNGDGNGNGNADETTTTPETTTLDTTTTSEG